jgi:K+-sensing histidine kinase KdpD
MASTASAHVSLQPHESAPGETVTYTVRVPTEGTIVTIGIELDIPESVHVVSVDGPADAAELPHIFDRFYRSSTQRERTTGAGLGLAIAKRFVEVHDGTITVESQRREGTLFSVRLPSNT